jgi:hypothetical protein
LLAVVAAVDVLVIAMWLRPAVLANGMILGGAVAIYLVLFAAQRMAATWKTVSAAFLFTCGVFLVAWTNAAALDGEFARLAVSFTALCLANLVFIGRMEDGTPGALNGVWFVVLLIVAASLGISRWYAAVALSAAGLAGLALWGGRFSAAARRVLADAVLLSPLLFR